MPPGVLASLAGLPGAKRTKMRQPSLGDAVQCWFPKKGGGLGWEEGAVSWVEPGGAHFRVTYDGEEYPTAVITSMMGDKSWRFVEAVAAASLPGGVKPDARLHELPACTEMATSSTASTAAPPSLWSAEEDSALTRMVASNGAEHWRERASRFPTNRSLDALRNRWKILNRAPAEGGEELLCVCRRPDGAPSPPRAGQSQALHALLPGLEAGGSRAGAPRHRSRRCIQGKSLCGSACRSGPGLSARGPTPRARSLSLREKRGAGAQTGS